jgi:ATP-dependent Clp protease ATP-binding subunit ClpA
MLRYQRELRVSTNPLTVAAGAMRCTCGRWPRRRVAVYNTAMALQVNDGALSEIASAGFDPVFGARPSKRVIQSQIENPPAKAILEGKFALRDTLRVTRR